MPAAQQKISRWSAFVITTALLVAASAVITDATETSFWDPYEEDDQTYALLHFDQHDPWRTGGETRAVETIGEVEWTEDGRFGGALKLTGEGALRVEPDGVFPGGYISVEAWVKLERLPEDTACIVWRPARVDRSAQYNPEVDTTKGFALLVDSEGRFHLQTTNCYYGRTVRTSSPRGSVPVGEWVHLAGVSATFPVTARRLYLNGREVAGKPLGWGQGIVVTKDRETEPSPIYIGADNEGKRALSGLVDEVRVYRNVFKFWPREDMGWARAADGREIPTGPPYFAQQHRAVARIPLDGTTEPAFSAVEGLEVKAPDGNFVRGVREQGYLGKVTVSAPGLLDLRRGAVEFWMRPHGVNNWSDRNRSFLSAGRAFTFYIFNGGHPFRQVSAYFRRRGNIHFVHDGRGTEFHEGRWRHVVISWEDREVRLYIDGEPAGRNKGVGLMRPDTDSAGSVIFNPHGIHARIDEIYVYRSPLLAEEVANAFARYRDPGQLKTGIRVPPIEVAGAFMPTSGKIYYRLKANVEPDKIERVMLHLRRENGESVLREDVPFASAERVLEVPELPDGSYRLEAGYVDAKDKLHPGGAFEFERERFGWEGNSLGITEEVYPPFEPVSVDGQRVSVVGRTYRMNGYGLWDSVVSEGRELLVAPMRLRALSGEEEFQWQVGDGGWERAEAKRAVYEAESGCGPVRVRTRSSIEIDGCMRVEMEPLPGENPAPVDDLWVEIPLRASEVPLFHEVTDGLRRNYSGRTPEGEGQVWTGADAHRYGRWLNGFVSYVWLGAERRGLAWFGENDRGWITEKGGSKKPIQEIIRRGERVALRVHLINKRATVTEPRRLVFGLQASPTKPMPGNWRKRIQHVPGALSVSPWGGLHCSYQGPYHDDWEIVDKIIEGRLSGEIDRQWFVDYAKKHDPPPVFGTADWVGRTLHFAGRARSAGPDRPIAVYQEEMAASTVREEWGIFGDEWTTAAHYLHSRPRRNTPESAFRKGRNANPSHRVTFSESYRDYGCHYANEWLKRGVSLYWDNTYPRASYNFRTTAAYRTESGRIQPATLLWNQREYQKRVWHLLQRWRREREEPLEWTLHMTNTLLLPIHTWGTVDLDHELGSKKPFSPAWLRTETIGRQIGNYPLSLYPVSGRGNPLMKKLAEERRARAEWGKCFVHEIRAGGKYDRLVRDFGYATDQVRVHNYWAETPVLRVRPDPVKWIVLEKPETKELLIVLASWAEEAVRAEVELAPAVLDWDPQPARIVDALSGDKAGSGRSFEVDLAGPYGVRILRASR